jgi:hypothetical protein
VEAVNVVPDEEALVSATAAAAQSPPPRLSVFELPPPLDVSLLQPTRRGPRKAVRTIGFIYLTV